jgi:hypothetical protein
MYTKYLLINIVRSFGLLTGLALFFVFEHSSVAQQLINHFIDSHLPYLIAYGSDLKTRPHFSLFRHFQSIVNLNSITDCTSQLGVPEQELNSAQFIGTPINRFCR